MANLYPRLAALLQSSPLNSIKILVLLVSLLLPVQVWAVYDLPNNDGDCPANCRQIPWLAGSDVWNSGTLPTYTGVNCISGLTEGDGTTDNSSAIQTCINNASANTAVILPAGIYYVNGTLTMKNNVVLRGAGFNNVFLPIADATATTLKLGTSGWITFGSGVTKGSEVLLSSGYTKGSQSITTSSSHGLVTNNWIVAYEHPDSVIPVLGSGVYGTCNWCGESDNTSHLMSQFNQVTGVAGNTLSLLRPMYYTFKNTLTPGIKKVTWNVSKAGLENIRLNGWSASRTEPLIRFAGALYCWVKNVEVYNDTNTAKGWPIYIEHSYGNEIRDSYIHKQRATESDRAYGIGLMFTTSDNKIENNIIREQRHGCAQEGGGSGNVWLYNYIDDIYYIYDYTIRENPEMNHGPHPYFTLWEGNISTGYRAEYAFGSSSHGVLFRNHLWGDLTGNYTGYDSNNPNYGFTAVTLDRNNTYYSLVGNVLGKTGLHTTWSNGIVYAANCNWVFGGTGGKRSQPTVYGFGCDDNETFDSNTYATTIKHGNYDYKTAGVAHWDGGADHTLKHSMYYSTKPSFFGGWTWPMIGPDISGQVLVDGSGHALQPAVQRWLGNNPPSDQQPSPPQNLRIIQ